MFAWAHLGENYFDDVIDEVLLLQVICELTRFKFQWMMEERMYKEELHVFIPWYPMFEQV